MLWSRYNRIKSLIALIQSSYCCTKNIKAFQSGQKFLVNRIKTPIVRICLELQLRNNDLMSILDHHQQSDNNNDKKKAIMIIMML